MADSRSLVRDFHNSACTRAMLSVGSKVMRLILQQDDKIDGLVRSIPAYAEAIYDGWDKFDKEHRAALRAENPFAEDYRPVSGVCSKCSEPLEPSRPSAFLVENTSRDLAESRTRLRESQDACDHLKENGRTRVVGYRTSDEVLHYICNKCFREWSEKDLPAFLAPFPDQIGRSI